MVYVVLGQRIRSPISCLVGRGGRSWQFHCHHHRPSVGLFFRQTWEKMMLVQDLLVHKPTTLLPLDTQHRASLLSPPLLVPESLLPPTLLRVTKPKIKGHRARGLFVFLRTILYPLGSISAGSNLQFNRPWSFMFQGPKIGMNGVAFGNNLTFQMRVFPFPGTSSSCLSAQNWMPPPKNTAACRSSQEGEAVGP